MNKTVIKYSTFTIVALIIFISIFTLVSKKQAEEINYKGENIIFAENFISYVVEDEMSFNLFGVSEMEKEIKDSSVDELVESIEFDNKNIIIEDFNWDTGIIHENYQLFNIIIDVKVNSEEIEEAEILQVVFKNGTIRNFDIGKVVLMKNVDISNSHFELGNSDYNVGYPRLNFDTEIKNISDNNINIESLRDITQTLSYEFDNKVLKVNQKSNISVTKFNLKDDYDYDFYTITPILGYEINKEQYSYYFPGVIYGVLESDEQKVEKIIN